MVKKKKIDLFKRNWPNRISHNFENTRYRNAKLLEGYDSWLVYELLNEFAESWTWNGKLVDEPGLQSKTSE